MNYITASKVLKIGRGKTPPQLFETLRKTYFEESRSPGVGLFFDDTKNLSWKENCLLFMRSWNTKAKNDDEKTFDTYVHLWKSNSRRKTNPLIISNSQTLV